MNRAKEFTKQTVVRVTPEMHRRLETDAKENGRTVAQTIRFLLREALGMGIET